MNDTALVACPRCEGSLRRVFEPVGVTFQGSGFYRTDSRGSGSRSGGVPTTSGEAPAPKKATPSEAKG
jgi:predicted nucleic acid-binding Zn ribbon protein